MRVLAGSEEEFSVLGFTGVRGAAGEGWRRDAQVSLHTCPLQSEAGITAGPPQTWAPAAGEGGAGGSCARLVLTAWIPGSQLRL